MLVPVLLLVVAMVLHACKNLILRVFFTLNEMWLVFHIHENSWNGFCFLDWVKTEICGLFSLIFCFCSSREVCSSVSVLLLQKFNFWSIEKMNLQQKINSTVFVHNSNYIFFSEMQSTCEQNIVRYNECSNITQMSLLLKQGVRSNKTQPEITSSSY